MATGAHHLLLVSALLCHVLINPAGGMRSYYNVKFDSFLPSNSCSPLQGVKPKGLPVVDRHGPCSPFTPGERLSSREILLQDEARAKSIQYLLANRRDKTAAPLGVNGAINLNALYGLQWVTTNYIVTVGFGTPRKDMTVVFDTGSDLTWIDCFPCRGGDCSGPRDTLFEPAKSSSYQEISCASAECEQLQSEIDRNGECRPPSPCDYRIEYEDGSISNGSFAADSLTLNSISFPNFRFACSHYNDGTFGATSGILGLGRGGVSLVSQQATAQFGGVFSYYLPTQQSHPGFLSFGPAISSNTIFVKLTDSSPYYGVELVGIKLGNALLPIQDNVWFEGSGTILDSGTVITRLPGQAYTELRSAFQKAMAGFTLVPPQKDEELLDTCYDFTGYDTLPRVPTVALVFSGGIEVQIALSGILYGREKSSLCLAFAARDPWDDWTILGNKVQRGYEVVYDAARGRVGFKAIDNFDSRTIP